MAYRRAKMTGSTERGYWPSGYCLDERDLSGASCVLNASCGADDGGRSGLSRPLHWPARVAILQRG